VLDLDHGDATNDLGIARGDLWDLTASFLPARSTDALV
jgi:hypothetical protein